MFDRIGLNIRLIKKLISHMLSEIFKTQFLMDKNGY